MRKLAIVIAAVVLWAPAGGRAQIGGCVPDESGSFLVELETDLGFIVVELFPNTAPGTVANFMKYVARGDFEDSIIHRSVPGFVIQGGGFRVENGAYAEIPTDPPITNEPCLSNTRATIAMARVGGQPDSATSQWFVNLVDNPFLDTADGVGFTAFGRVTTGGMVAVDDIGTRPVFDALTTLELPFNQAFRELPLASLPVDPPEGYGCSRATPVHGLADEDFDFPLEDPLRSEPGFSAFVPILLDPDCTGIPDPGPPLTPCTPGIGRDVFLVDLVQQVFFQPRLPMSCAAVAESEISWTLRRDGTETQLFDQNIQVIAVPEPGQLLMLSAGVAFLATAGRRRMRP